MYGTKTCMGPKHVQDQNMYGTKTCTGPKHVRDQNMYGTKTCTGPKHVWDQNMDVMDIKGGMARMGPKGAFGPVLQSL